VTTAPTLVGTPNFVSSNGTNPPLLTFVDPPRLDGDYEVMVWGSQSTGESSDMTNNAGMVRIGPPFAMSTNATRASGIYGRGVPVDATASATVQCARTGPGTRNIVGAFCFRGVDLAAPAPQASSSVTTLGTTTVTVAALIPAVDNMYAFVLFSSTHSTGGTDTITPPSGWTQIGNRLEPVGVDTTVSRNRVYVYGRALGAAGTGYSCAITYATAPAQATGQMVLLRPKPDPVAGRAYPAPATVTGDVKSYGKFAEYS
jgi:hypothetical protein